VPFDFSLYKPRLTEYLSSHGVDVPRSGNFACFVHDDSTPSMVIRGERAHCYGCGFDGDIYDCCGHLDGLTDEVEQYKAVEAFFCGSSFQPVSDTYKMESTKKERFTPDIDAIDRVIEYLKGIRSEHKADILQFCKARGFDDAKYGNRFAWWPGIAHADIDRETMIAAGIINTDRDDNGQAWNHDGIVVRVGLGFKLHYIGHDGKCIKRESRGGHTFPFPALPEVDTCILVEGELDAVSCRYVGIDAVSIGGLNGLGRDDIVSFGKFQHIILALDNDASGRIALGLEPPPYARYKTIPQLLREGGYSGEIRYIDYPKGLEEKDPDDLVKHGKADVLKALIENAKIWEDKGDVNENDNNFIREEAKKECTESGGGGCANGDIRIQEDQGETNEIRDEQKDLIPREAIPFQFLGFDAEAYYALPKNQNIPVKVPRGDKGIKEKLNEVADPDWWGAYFTATNKDGDEYTDYGSAVKWFRREQIKRGMYNTDRLLGTGAHYDNGRVVVNTGLGVCTPSGDWSTYEAYTGHNTYTRSPHELVLGDKPWSVEESQYFLDQLRTFTFDSPFAYYAIAGYCALSPFASMLRRRPHIWITGQKGEGKSVLLKDLIYATTGEGYTVYKEGLTTEAAFRQTLKRDNRPIINDEFEINRREDQSIIDGVLTLSRIAYAGESVSKGTSNQQGISFTTKIMFCFASINVNIRNDADRSRIVVCRMQQSRDRMKSIRNIDGLRGRMFRRLESVNANIDLAHILIEDAGYSSRDADTHAPFLAAYWMMLNDTTFGEGNDYMLGEMKEAVTTIGKSDERITDEDRIIIRILQERIRFEGGTETTVARMLVERDDMQKLVHDKELQNFGIRRTKAPDRIKRADGLDVLCIVSKHDSISKMLADMSFANYREVLKRNSAYIGTEKMSIGGVSTTSMIFRWDMIENKYLKDAEELEEVPF